MRFFPPMSLLSSCRIMFYCIIEIYCLILTFVIKPKTPGVTW